MRSIAEGGLSDRKTAPLRLSVSKGQHAISQIILIAASAIVETNKTIRTVTRVRAIHKARTATLQSLSWPFRILPLECVVVSNRGHTTHPSRTIPMKAAIQRRGICAQSNPKPQNRQALRARITVPFRYVTRSSVGLRKRHGQSRMDLPDRSSLQTLIIRSWWIP